MTISQHPITYQIYVKPFLPHFWSFVLFLVLAMVSINQVNAQNISFDNTIPQAGLTVCGDAETFEISFTNNTESVLQNPSIQIDFPTGIKYQIGSLNENSSFNIQESSTSNLGSITLSSNAIPVGATATFSIAASADFDAYNAQLAGATFQNTITINYTGGSVIEDTDSYNILYAAISVINVNPMSASVFVGQTFTRTVTLVNGGYGSVSSIDIVEIDDANLRLDGTDIGTFDANTNTITLSNSDFQSIGNNDTSFDQNESITITQTLTAIGCNSTQSEITAYWGCSGQNTASNQKYPYTTINLYPPSLDISAQASWGTCVDGSGDTQQLTITNTGSGPANEIDITIIPEESYSITEVDASSIAYTLAGNTVSLTPSNTNPAYAHDCFTDNAIDGFTVRLPAIQPGETLVLNWDNYTCNSQFCGNLHFVGWEYEAEYTDMCNSRTYQKDGNGQQEFEKNFSTFFESPSDLVDTQEGTYSFIISSATFKLPEGTNPYFEAVFDIPLGLVWSGDADDLTYTSNVTTWTPSSVNYDNNSRKLTAKYDMPLPPSFRLNHSVFDINLTADCSAGVNWVTVGMQLFYVLDSACPSPYRIPMTCYETPQTQLHCPEPCEHGLAFQNFEVERISFGQPDNDLDGLPDANGSFDYTKIKTNRVMHRDTFETTFTGWVKTSATFPSWSYGYARSAVPYGNSIDILAVRVEILDASTGTTLTCDQVPFTSNVSGGFRNVDIDFSPVTLAALACNDFSGFVLEQDDQVSLVATYRLSENIGGSIEQVMIQNDFYVSNTANGTAYQCNDWNGNFTVIGYYHRNNISEQYDIRTCTKTITQNYRVSIGDCCTNYAGGNVFPYEYRNWTHLKNMRVEIPDGYAFVSGYVDQWRTAATNSTVKETATIAPISEVDGTLIFNMENYLVSNGGTINASDDGYHGKVYIELQPECTVNEAANNPVSWFFTFQENDFLGGNPTQEFSGSLDYLRYYRSKLQITSTLPTQEGIAPTVSWDISIKSKDAAAENAWFYLQDIANQLDIIEVRDLSNNSIISPTNDFYQIGNLNWNESRTFRITSTYNSCSLSNLKVISGHDCNGYPSSLAAYACASEEFMLYIAPQPSQLQVRFNNTVNTEDECDNIIGIELEMLSSKLAAVNDLEVNLSVPSDQVITIESGSMEVLYPNNGSYASLPDPALSNNQYLIRGADMDASIGTDGLVGVTDITANIVKLRFNIVLSNDFQPGDILDIDISSKRPCGDNLPTLAMTYDPNASFGSLEGIGLDDVSNNWAAAWADYDNDGFVDLFVTNYETDKPNLLYHNNGDGTFSKVTSGAIATDIASSLAATWGDYDNDGDLDLYVANNIGYPNFLYRNNGNGSFVKISNDPVVTDLSYAHGVSWVDYDNDGFLDLFVTDYFTTKFNKMYHNNGDGTFTKETTAAPVFEASTSVSGVWADYNNDGLVDLFVANTNDENNSLYENRGNGTFLKINTGTIVNDGGNSVGASWGDYNNDGNMDLFVANSGGQNNFLYQNNGDGSFTKISGSPITSDGGHSHGSAWADYDNDGDLDLFVSNDQGQDNFLYANNGDGTFSRTINQITQDSGDSFGAAWADMDNDGDLDLFIANHDANENFVYANSRGKCQGKFCMVLEGTNSNRSAIGTKIQVKANIYGQDIWQTREVSGQTGGGIGGQNELKTIFGLGNASVVDSIIIQWSSGYRQVMTNQSINDCVTVTEDVGSEVCGIAYYDINENCVQDNDEPTLSNVKLVIQPGNRVVMTDENGAYSVILAPDDYTITQDDSEGNWTATCTPSQSVTVTGIGNTFCGYDFPAEASCTQPDLKVSLSPTAHRVGFENLIAVTYKNEGGAAATDVVLEIDLGTDVIFKESSLPISDFRETICSWNLGTVEIGETNTIYITDSISTAAVIGEDIMIQANIVGQESDCTSGDNTFMSVQRAVGAIDPNDILVSPEGFIDAGTELTYRIRFQNVGNAPVSRVRIEDRLPAGLDLSSFQQGITSHPYTLEIQDSLLIWTFDNINMPDSLTNEPESHGFILFKIKTHEHLVDQTKIENQALIYFDNVAPLATNTVVNIIGKPNNNSNETGQLRIFPNPMHSQGTISINDFEGQRSIYTIQVYDVLGNELFVQKGLDTEYYELQKNRLGAGCYFIKATSIDGDIFTGRLIIE